MGKKLDLKNQKFGRLIVLEEAGRDNNKKVLWLCQCECGKQKIIRGSDLTSGKIQSCGCLNKERTKQAIQEKTMKKVNEPGFYKDLTGQRFGKLIVLEFDKDETIKQRKLKNNKFTWWKCQCDCGNIVSVNSTSLTGGHTKSCGCLQREIASFNMKKIQPLGAEIKKLDLTNQRFGKLIALKAMPSKNGSTFWKCQCDCGNIIEVATSSLTQGVTHSCGCLKKSLGELKIEEILTKNNINFLKEVKFNDLKDKTFLRFDFAILQDNKIIKLIEYDGKQHFKESNSSWYSEDLVKHDNMKNNYCKIKRIPLLRISYHDYDKITLEYLLNKTTIL